MSELDEDRETAERNEAKLKEALNYYHGCLQQLREAYAKAAKPYIDKIIEIENIRPRRMVIDPEVYQLLTAAPPNSERGE